MFQVNGKLTNKINIKDRAVQYGDGVFETIAVKKNSVEFWNMSIYHRHKVKGLKISKNAREIETQLYFVVCSPR